MWDEVLASLIDSIAKVLKMDPATLSADTGLYRDLNIRSLELQAVVTQIENAYDLYIKYPSFARSGTIGEAADFIVKELEG